jgi:hypothetical protein
MDLSTVIYRTGDIVTRRRRHTGHPGLDNRVEYVSCT